MLLVLGNYKKDVLDKLTKQWLQAQLAHANFSSMIGPRRGRRTETTDRGKTVVNT